MGEKGMKTNGANMKYWVIKNESDYLCELTIAGTGPYYHPEYHAAQDFAIKFDCKEDAEYTASFLDLDHRIVGVR
jgi:hypothetical protein